MRVTWRKFTGPVSAEVALAVVATAAGGLVYRGFFATPEYLPALGLACLAGAATAVLTAARAMRPWSTLLVAVAGLALVATYGVFGDTVADGLPTGRTGSAILHGVLNGWNRMLTVAVPADVWGELLMTPVLVVWAAAFSAVTLTLRTRIILAPLGPPLVAFLFAVLVVGNLPGAHATATIVFLIAALALAALRAHRTTTGGAVRVGQQPSQPTWSLIPAGLAVTVSALFGIVSGQALPLASGQHRFDPRTLQPPPITITNTLTPLAQLKPQLTEDPPRTLFTVRIEGEPATRVDRVRTAALDAFDGTTWTSSDTYRVAGSHLAVDPALTHARPISARIELKDLSGPYLPVLGWPSRLTPVQRTTGEFGFNATSGMVVSTAPAVRGLRYDLVGEISNWDEGLPLALPSTTTPQHAYARALPAEIPAPVQRSARELTAAHPTPYGKLAALEHHLRSRPYNLSAPPGHSYSSITRLLTNSLTTGYAEQHATAFTVLARAVGFPARVAVGYRLRNYRDGTYTVTTADAHAWPEAHFAGYGWVAFEPTNNAAAPPPLPPPEIPFVVPAQPTPQPAAPQPVNSDSSASATTANQPGFDWSGAVRSTLLVVITMAALVVLTAGYIAAAKARRRGRRRRAPDHAAQVLGAWQEMIDRLTERGITPPISLTAQEVALHARTTTGTAARSIAVAAPLASAAIFAPGQLDHHEAEHAWQLVEQLHTELYPRRMSVARLRATVDPRPLWTAWLARRQRRRAWERLELGRYL